MFAHIRNRALRGAVLGLLLLAAFVSRPARAADPPPIVFVHGNGDSAALWQTTLWRFESNGYDPQLLFAIDFTRPSARGDDTKPQPNRSSTVDQAAELSAFVTRALLMTGKDKVVLVGSSRGGYAIRNYIRFAAGHAAVDTAILCGTPNHGVLALPVNLNGEFNGQGVFLSKLNAGSEVHPGVKFFTIRSDKLDKYAQPTGEFLGMAGKPTGVTFEGPELKGATNIVIAGLDHREVAFHPKAFREMYKAITGREPKTLDAVPVDQPVLDGVVSGTENGAPTNLPIAGAKVEVFAVNPATGERQGTALHQATTGADGRWGPFTGSSQAHYEIVAAAAGYPTTHFYRTPFPRGSAVVHLRLAPADKKFADAGAVVTLTRPRGYLGVGRDTFSVDGNPPDGVNAGVPGTASGTRVYPAGPARAVPMVLNGEQLAVRTWPAAEGHVVYGEFHY
jgi:pimeloyl-ACP methyl ester carboxylesterase